MPAQDRTDRLITLAAAAVLAVACLLVLRPFVSALLWALILSFSTWPAFVRLERLCGGRRTLAAALSSILLAVLLLVPLLLVGSSLTEDLRRVIAKINLLVNEGLPPPPPWLETLPLVGDRLNDLWLAVMERDDAALASLKPHYEQARRFLIQAALSVGRGTLELALSVLATFFFYRDGRAGAEQLSRVAERLAGDRARGLLEVTGSTIRAVVHGLIGTALAQGLLASVGFLVAGLPNALFFGFVTFLLSLFPVGAPLVWLPASAWLLYNGDTGWAIFLFIWGLLVVSSVDNFIKPWLISRGSDLPLLLVFLGVLGGALAFGFLGIFLGPVLLGVGYAMLRQWSATPPKAGPPATPSPRD